MKNTKQIVKVEEQNFEIDFVGSSTNQTTNYFFYVNGEKFVFVKSSVGDEYRKKNFSSFRKFSAPIRDVMKKLPKQVWSKLEEIANSNEKIEEPGASFFEFTEKENEERQLFSKTGTLEGLEG